MTDFVFELLSEEIPARMQAAAAEQLRVRFGDGIKGRVPFDGIDVHATPRRLVLYARGMGATGNVVSEERRGPRADAPAASIEGFLRSTGLTREQLEERATPKGAFLYAVVEQGGRPTTELLAELIPQIIRDFDWPKSMRWGAASARRDSLRWVRPLTGIVALFGDAVVPFEVAGVTSGRMTQGHRFLHKGPVEIADAASYAATLRAAHVIVAPSERLAIIRARAAALATAAGLTLIEDEALAVENAGLTEWPVPLLGHFDAAFLDVPREIIQLTMRTNQKYFACVDADGKLAPAFVCVANIAGADASIVAGNQKVLAARLADAKFFWDADVKAGLESFTPKLADIVFHEKLGTLADKVDRVAKLARWLVESGAVSASLHPSRLREGPGVGVRDADAAGLVPPPPSPLPEVGGVADLAALAEQAARLCKADLPSATVGEFPEVQGIAGRYLALAQGIDPQVADAIRDHYKPVGQGDDVPTAPVSVAVALADKLDTLVGFFAIGETPTGSRDPYALRRAMLGIISLIRANRLRVPLDTVYEEQRIRMIKTLERKRWLVTARAASERPIPLLRDSEIHDQILVYPESASRYKLGEDFGELINVISYDEGRDPPFRIESETDLKRSLNNFVFDRLRIQLKDLGYRHDVISAVLPSQWSPNAISFSWLVAAVTDEPDEIRSSAKYLPSDEIIVLERAVSDLQTAIESTAGVNALAVFRRVDSIMKGVQMRPEFLGAIEVGAPEPVVALRQWCEMLSIELQASLVVRDFRGALAAIGRGKAIVDSFFDQVTVNAPEENIREARMALLALVRRTILTVADLSKIEG